jgi:septation ring formation regulator EzrA
MDLAWRKRSPVTFAVSSPLSDIINQVVTAVNNVTQAIDNVKSTFAAVTSVINAVNNALDNIQSAVTSLTDIAKQITNIALAPVEAARHILSTFETIKTNALAIEEEFRSLPGRVLRNAKALANGTQDLESNSQSQALQAENLTRQARAQARTLRGLSAQRQQEIAKQTINQTALAAFTAREGQDLRDVSKQFYGTQNEWRALATYNGLHGSRLTAGTIVIVPKISQPGT